MVKTIKYRGAKIRWMRSGLLEFFSVAFDINLSDVLALQGFGIIHFGHPTLRRKPLDQ
jgi:hypothetical protein